MSSVPSNAVPQYLVLYYRFSTVLQYCTVERRTGTDPYVPSDQPFNAAVSHCTDPYELVPACNLSRTPPIQIQRTSRTVNSQIHPVRLVGSAMYITVQVYVITQKYRSTEVQQEYLCMFVVTVRLLPIRVLL